MSFAAMSDHPLNDNGNVDGRGGDWRQQQPRVNLAHDPHFLQPPPVVRETLPLPPPLPQQHHAPAYNNQAMLRQQALPPVLLNQQQQRQSVSRSPFSGAIASGNYATNNHNNVGSVLNADLSNNVQDMVVVDVGIVQDPEEQLGGDDDALASSTFQTSVSGWSEVDVSGGGIPPSARSLHSAALLNGVMYVFGTFKI